MRYHAAKKYAVRILPILFWLGVWQLVSMGVGQPILLVSPLTALVTLLRLMGTMDFYLSIALSFGRILLGFSLAACAGVILGTLAFRFVALKTLLSPLVSAIKATPVASFVILALVWLNSANLSIFTAFLMVLPVLYGHTMAGLNSADPKLLEMTKAFGIGHFKTVRAVYIPALYPYFLTGCHLALGICWKAGIAAEVIGQPAASIGDKLYRAKLFLATDELFAWTLAIIILSVLFEKVVVCCVQAILKKFRENST